MDKLMEDILGLAAQRDSIYVKGETSDDELPRKTAELGIYLLQSAKKLAGLKGRRLNDELSEIQKYVDDFRKVVFLKKAAKP